MCNDHHRLGSVLNKMIQKNKNKNKNKNEELVRARNVSVNHSADARSELSMAHDVSHGDTAMRGELLMAHNSGGKSHSELYMARDAHNITQHEPIGSAEHCCPERTIVTSYGSNLI